MGLAVSHGVVAAPINSIIFDKNDKKKFFGELSQIILDQKVEKIIVGLPLMDDESTKQSEITYQIGEEIASTLKLPVEFTDESFTSIEAKENNAKDIDSESARIILERYLPR